MIVSDKEAWYLIWSMASAEIDSFLLRVCHLDLMHEDGRGRGMRMNYGLPVFMIFSRNNCPNSYHFPSLRGFSQVRSSNFAISQIKLQIKSDKVKE